MSFFFFVGLVANRLSILGKLYWRAETYFPSNLLVLKSGNEISILHIEFNFSLKTSLMAQMVKRLSTMRETWVRSLGREDPLEKAMAIHSSTIV